MGRRLGGQPIVRQRQNRDCGVAALADYTHLPYEQVYVAAVKRVPKLDVKGLGLQDLIDVAKILGRRFLTINYRRVNLEEQTGILGVNWNLRPGQGHWVGLRTGHIIDPWEPTVWDADEYLITNNARVGHLLTEDRE